MSNLKPYPKYKPSGVEWLGDVPEGWETKKLSHWFDAYGSGTTPPNEADYSDSGTPWVTTGELRENTIFSTDKRVTQKAIASYSALKVHPADSLVIAMYGATVGRIGRLGIPATLNQACFAIHPNDLISLDLLEYWFQGFRDELITLATGAGQPNISGDKIKTLLVSAPIDSNEQSAIATFLDRETTRIDSLVEKKQRFIELLKEKRQALITDAVTGKFDVSTGKPYPAYKPSGVEWLGDVPECWGIKPFFAQTMERKEPNKGMIETNLLSLSYGRIVPKDINTDEGLLPASFETYQLIHPNDIVFRLTDLQNDKRSLRSAICKEKGIITSAYLAVRTSGFDADYLNYLMRSYDVMKVFYSMGGGMRQSMKFDDLKRLPLIVPSVREQTAIVTFLDGETTRIDSLMEKTEKSIELLKERRSALITAVVTGKIDVRDAA
ncbi:restriction endonuclease subunit S [Mariprofundus sp. KV]|uniref:restriction endonuclease subunit S n=1 Tax=Mariprofundus sp. KV TaxID=2608715 RepID=UPI00159FF3AE|nr:restriction endonuclease subunit S [Mariprofundus sp. KV]NWF36070.1 restriction endonuclease subunit S [Mariprofundus sp. KV]